MESEIRALIVDDEMLSRKKIRSLLDERSDIVVCGECANGLEALQAIREHAPDLVFLDIRMPELGGFELIEALGVETIPAIVFVTAYDRYAIQAFEKNALDYLLKPFTDIRFHNSVERALMALRNRAREDVPTRLQGTIDECKQKETFIQRLVVKSATRVKFIGVEEVDWVEVNGNYISVHVGGEAYLLRETMNNLESKLDPARFLRIHRSTIVNIDRIKELRSDVHHGTVVVMKDGLRLSMSRRYRERMNQTIGNYL